MYKLADIVINASGKMPSAGAELELYATSDVPDRYGRIAVHALSSRKDKDGGWIQGDLLKRGLAVHFAPFATPSCLEALREQERQARSSKAGLWRASDAIIRANDIGKLVTRAGQLTLVRGTIRSLGDRKRHLYLNFGSNWSEDFTVMLAKSGAGAFKGNLTRLQQAAGRTVLVRGVVELRGGPLIRVLHDAQIEFDDLSVFD